LAQHILPGDVDVKTQWLALAAVAATGGALAVGGTACFSPSFDPCAVFCGEEGQCPQDQLCLEDKHCHASLDEEMCTPGGGSDGGTLTDGPVTGDDSGGGADSGGGRDGGADAGDVDAGVPVTPTQPGDLLITEIQKDPDIVNDEVGEWFEIYNPTDRTFDATALRVSDASVPPETFDFPDDADPIAPGQYVVLVRNSDDALNGGVLGDYTYETVLPPFQLANASDEIIITNTGGDEIDRVEYDEVNFPTVPGRSLSLDPGRLDVNQNDLGASWCDGQDVYGDGDLGSPGSANPPCP
jgi:uncharacterized protein